jgi:hypothetical protein
LIFLQQNEDAMHPIEVLVGLDEDEEEGDWRALSNQSWAKDWCDPAGDIYTLEDGEPSDKSRILKID